MKTPAALVALATFCLALPLPSFAQLHSQVDQASELLVKWKDGPYSSAAAEANASVGVSVKRNFGALGWQLVRLPSGMSASQGLKMYQNLASVLAVEHNVRFPARLAGVVPNDPMFGQEWHLAKIGATNAWQTTTGSSNIVVAVLDTGVDYTHSDLASNMWRNPGETGPDANGQEKATNGIDDDGNGYVDDVYGVDVSLGTGDPMDIGFVDPPNLTVPYYHGTACAGFIGAVGNNAVGLAGVNWSVRIMSVRFWGGSFSDPQLYSPTIWCSDALAAWDYLIMMKRRGVNLRVASNSWGGATKSAAVRDAILAGGDEGILAVFPALNEAVDQDVYSYFPGASRLWSAITVAASTESDGLTSFSCWGRSTVDLAAPGINLRTTTKGGTYLSATAGTSFSCPIVSGAAALLLAANPSLTINELKAALFGSVDQPLALRSKLITQGRLNVARAFEYLTNANPPAIIVHMTPAGLQTLSTAPIQMTFNRPMNRDSVEAAFLVSPPLSGTFVWADDNRSFSFTHVLPFNVGTNYAVRVLGTALDDAGGTLDGNYNRNREGSPTDDFLWTFRLPIPNDDFADAETLVGTVGFVQASNRYAFIEGGEPAHVTGNQQLFGSSVWYRWDAPASGWTTFDLTNGTTFDSLLAVYTGAQLDQLVAVAGNDNYGTRSSSRLSFPSVAGTNYSIVVASKSELDPNQAGNFKLAWYPTPAPSFIGSQFSPSSGAPGTIVTLFGTNFTGATSVLFNGASASFTNALTNNLDLRITAVVPSDAISGPITVVTPHGSATTSTSFQVPLPRLALSLTGPNLLIRWPGTSTAWVLEETADLVYGPWTPVTQTPIMTNGETRMLLEMSAEHNFYRLKRN